MAYDYRKTLHERAQSGSPFTKAFRFDGNEVFIKKIGNSVVQIPVDNSWETLNDSLMLFSEDFMDNHAQPVTPIREDI